MFILGVHDFKQCKYPYRLFFIISSACAGNFDNVKGEGFSK